MIDNLTILFTTLMILYVIVRAAKLDRILPWFETRSLYDLAQKRAAAEPEGDPWRRPGRKPAPAAAKPFGPRR